MTVARRVLVSAIGAGTATACLLPGIDPAATTGTAGAAGSGGSGAGGDVSCDPQVQTAGDCLAEVCDSVGTPTTVPDDTDVPDAETCKVARCENGAPLIEDAPNGTACGEGLQCEAGICAGCRSAGECGTAAECTYYECDNPGPSGRCTLLNVDFDVPCGSGSTCASEHEVTTEACDGQGTCAPTTESCDPYACSGGACTNDCTMLSGCAPGALCEGGGICNDCRTCGEWLNNTDSGNWCTDGFGLHQALLDCTCIASGPCLVLCNTTLCTGASPVGFDNCEQCLQQACKPQLDACAADVDPVP